MVDESSPFLPIVVTSSFGNFIDGVTKLLTVPYPPIHKRTR